MYHVCLTKRFHTLVTWNKFLSTSTIKSKSACPNQLNNVIELLLSHIMIISCVVRPSVNYLCTSLTIRRWDTRTQMKVKTEKRMSFPLNVSGYKWLWCSLHLVSHQVTWRELLMSTDQSSCYLILMTCGRIIQELVKNHLNSAWNKLNWPRFSQTQICKN